MSISKLMSTERLRQYIMDIIENQLIEYRIPEVSLSIEFAPGKATSAEGTYVFSDEQGYHYLVTERGKTVEEKVTDKLESIVYWCLDEYIFDLALKYAANSTEKFFRKILFEKEAEIFSHVSETFLKKRKWRLQKSLRITHCE